MTRVWYAFVLILCAGTPTLAEESIGGPAMYVQTELDAWGNVHLLYVTHARDIFYKKYNGSSWSDTAVYMGNSTPCWLTYTYPAIAVGNDGIPQAVYGTSTGNYPHNLNYFTYAKAHDPDGDNWTYETIGNDGLRRGTADIALDESNQPHIVYKQSNKYSPWWHKIIYRDPNGIEHTIREKWDPGQVVRPRIAYGNGTVHITWWENGNNRTNIWYAASPDFAPEQLSNVGYRHYVDSPGIAVAPDGHVEIVYLVANWNGSPYYLGLFRTQPGWTDGVQLTGAVGLNESWEDFWPPNIAFDGVGRRFISWYHYAENRHYYMGPEGTVEFAPYGHIDVCAGTHGAYYVRAAGQPGWMYFEQISGGGSNIPPSISVLSPPSGNAEANSSYTITWNDTDPDDNATIALYYDTNNSGYNGVLIPGAGSIPEDPEGSGDSFNWNISGLPDNSTYWVYAVINDGTNPAVMDYSPGYLFVNHLNDVPWIELTAPSSADTTYSSDYVLTWNDGDPDDNARISLYYSSVDSPIDSTEIVRSISEDDGTDEYVWDLSIVPPGTYRIYATIDDGEYVRGDHSDGTITELMRVTFSPMDDASVYRNWEPGQPHGDLPDLDFGADDNGGPDEMAFFNFSVSGLEYDVVKAYLRVYCVDEGGGGGAHSVSSTDWTEDDLTWNNMPSIGATPVHSIGWLSPWNWYSYNVTNLFSGNGRVAVALRSTTPNGTHVASKEHANQEFWPYLEIFVGGEITPQPPTARIDSIVPSLVIQGYHPQVAFYGSGWDNDQGGQSIEEWKWSSNLNGALGATQNLVLSPDALAVGTHQISLTVRDNEGEWSEPDIAGLEVKPPDTSPPIWPNGTGIQALVDQGTGGVLQVSWNFATDENPPVSYNVYYNTTSPAFVGERLEAVTWTSGLGYDCTFALTGLTNGQEYYVGVRATDLVGNEDTNTIELSATPTEPANTPPWIELTAPATQDTAYNTSYTIKWNDSDPDDNAQIALYYSPESMPDDSTLIAQGIPENNPGDEYDWGLLDLTPGTYRIYATISDEEYLRGDHSDGTVTSLMRVIFYPTDDASVYKTWEPDQPHGDMEDLDYGADDHGYPDEMAFFSFSVSGLEYGVVKAQLNVYCVDEGGGGGAYSVSSADWTEETLTWNNMPGVGMAPVHSIEWVSSWNWYAYDITDLVSGNGRFAVALRSGTSNGAHVASKEYPSPEFQPHLELLVAGDMPPSTVTGITCTPLGSIDLQIQWLPSSGSLPIVGYRIYRSPAPYFEPSFERLLAEPETTEYTDCGVLGNPDVDHYYIVTAYDSADNESAPSEIVGESEFNVTGGGS